MALTQFFFAVQVPLKFEQPPGEWAGEQQQLDASPACTPHVHHTSKQLLQCSRYSRDAASIQRAASIFASCPASGGLSNIVSVMAFVDLYHSCQEVAVVHTVLCCAVLCHCPGVLQPYR